MVRSSLRSWLLFVAMLFSALVVGGMALTSYVVVSDGMTVVASDATARVADEAVRVVEDGVRRTTPGPASDPDDTRSALEAAVGAAPAALRSGGLFDGDFVVYGSDLEPVWFSDIGALSWGTASARARTFDEALTNQEVLGAGGMLRGLTGPANLGTFVVHTPILHGEDVIGVIDVVYYPNREEAVIDGIRAPMFTLALSAMFIMVVMMQTSMGWVLRLVDNLRKAADSIDAGRLDVHLPAEGEHEIGDLARSLNQLIDRLRRRAEAQTRFVADASHELATPVAGIRGYTNILRAWGADDPEVRAEAINAIDRESRRMARLCGDLLALVRDERGLEFKNVRFDLNERVREVLAAAATRYIEKGQEYVGPDEGQLYMVSDPDRVEDAISILVDNAAKYTPEGGRVVVRTRRKRDTVIVEVEDTGLGIPAEDLASIFDRFYRSDASRSKETGGFGLGLPIAKTIVDAAGGTIDVRSTPGEGTVFTVVLPRGRS